MGTCVPMEIVVLVVIIFESALPRSSLLHCNPLSGVKYDLGDIKNHTVECCLILRRCIVKRRRPPICNGACRRTLANEVNKNQMKGTN